MNRILTAILLVLLVVNCKSKKAVTSKSKEKRELSRKVTRHKEKEKAKEEIVIVPQKEEVKPSAPKVSHSDLVLKYIKDYKDIAKTEMKLYKVPASITLAQGILESGSGQSRLAREANNHFGIKCHEWGGERIYHDDDDFQECFRKYKHPNLSFQDHSIFLTDRKRYANLFKLQPDDYKGWARELRVAGYATDPNYPEKLIRYIEQYKLHEFDKEVLNEVNAPSKVENTPKTETLPATKTVHIVEKGETLYSISKRYNTTVGSLQQLNGLDGTAISIGQELVISAN